MIEDTLKEREKTHGDFGNHSVLSQKLKSTIQSSKNWENLVPKQKESLEMICHKISRILCGNPNHDDHWVDISGYATLAKLDEK